MAIFGVIVAFWLEMGKYKNPRWAVALGTPVLVWTALSYLITEIWRRKWRRWTGKERPEESGDNDKEDEYDEDEAEKGEVRRHISQAYVYGLLPMNSSQALTSKQNYS